MMRYADPTACPDCHSTIATDPDRCPDCSLPLRNPTAAELFRTLQHADALLGRLRSLPVRELAPLTTTTADVAAYPAPAPRRETPTQPGAFETRLRGTSVASVLLGLGALCLLVASVIFLAVAWSWLGVGGRTAVLVALTAAAATAGLWWAHRGLRVAGESLTTVALGLLTLDLFGAADAGWLGAASDTYFAPTLGFVVAAAGVALALASRPSARLMAPQIIGALGFLVAYVGLRNTLGHDLWISALAVVILGSAALVVRPQLAPLAYSLLSLSALTWLDLLGSALSAVPTPVTVTSLWGGAGWALIVAAAYLAAPGLHASLRATAAWWLGASAILATFTFALPALEGSSDRLVIIALIAAAVWTSLAWVLPTAWTWAARLPALAAALPVALGLLSLLGEAMVHLSRPAPPYSATIGARLPQVDTLLSPWLLVPTSVLLTALALCLTYERARLSAGRVLGAVLATAAVSGLVTLSLFPVPIWVVVTGFVGASVVLVGLSLPREDRWAIVLVVTAGTVFGSAFFVGRPSAGLLTLVALALVLVAGTMVRAAFLREIETAGYLALPLGVALSVYGVGETLGTSETYRALVVVLLLGLAAVLRPRVDLEISSAVCGGIIAGVAVFGLEGGPGTLALLLTLSGALVSISALLNPERRALGWVGGGLLAAATWVRLADLGVGTPEAYTLPSALALLAVGGWLIRKDPTTPTAKLLGPGLVLATLPSLLWTLADPISVRAALLGVACLGLTLGGSALRWNAPVVVGSTVGAVLVLIELAPYAVQTPQWVVIGLAGAVLTAVGVTWESRMQDVRHAGAYLERLR